MNTTEYLNTLNVLKVELEIAAFVNQFTKKLIDQDLRNLEEEIQATKIVNLCLTGE